MTSRRKPHEKSTAMAGWRRNMGNILHCGGYTMTRIHGSEHKGEATCHRGNFAKSKRKPLNLDAARVPKRGRRFPHASEQSSQNLELTDECNTSDDARKLPVAPEFV